MTLLPMIPKRKMRRVLTEEDKKALAAKLYKGLFPGLDKAYAADPRTLTANTLLQQGTNSSPLAGGTMEGIARALSGALGGHVSRQQRNKYLDQENYAAENANTAMMRKAGLIPPEGNGQPMPNKYVDKGGIPDTTMFNLPPGGAGQGGMGGIAQALMAPVQQQQQQQQPQLPPMPVPPQGTVDPSMLAQNPIQPPVRGMSGGRSSVYSGTNRADLLNGVTSWNESRNNPRAVSPKGARGLMQVMPATAANPGFGIRPSNGTPEDDVRLGKEYRAVMEQKYGGDVRKMWAAYNAGPGATDRRIRRYGDNWLAHMPAETREYVARNLTTLAQRGGLNGGGTEAAQVEVPEGVQAQAAPSVPVPELPEAPVMPQMTRVQDPVKSARMAMASELLGMNMDAGTKYMLSQPYFNEGLGDEQKAAEDQWSAQNTRDYLQDQMALSRYGAAESDIRGQKLSERTAAIATNWRREEATTEHQRELEKQDQQDKAALERELAGVRERKPPVFAMNEFYKNSNTIDDGANVLTQLNSYTKGVGLDKSLGDIITQRADPGGVQLRSAITNYAGLILHGVSGAAVTPEEFQRNRGWLPQVNDTPEAIATKVRNIQARSQTKVNRIQSMFGNQGVFASQPAGVAAPSPAGGGGKLTDEQLKAQYGI